MSRVLATCRSLGSSPGWTKSAVSLRGSQTHTSLEPLVAIKSTRDLKVLGLSGLRMKLLWGCCCNGFGHASGACYDDELTFYHRGIILQQGSMGLVFFLCCNRQRFGCIEQRPWAKSAEWNAMTWVKLNLTFWNSLWISAGVCIYIYIFRFVEGHAVIFLWRSAILTAPRWCSRRLWHQPQNLRQS